MAKKEVKVFNFSKVGSLLSDLSKKGIPLVVANDGDFKKAELIDTGIYILNGALSGSLFGGVQSGRITALAGDSGCLYPTEKVQIYTMRTQNKKHEVYEERNDSTFQKR